MILAKWTAHPARRRPRDVALVASVVLLTMAAVLSAFQSIYFTVLAAVVLLISVSAFLFPTHYTVTDLAIEERRLFRTRRRPWQDIRRLAVGRDAAVASPFVQPTWLDRYRAIVIRFDGTDRDDVVRALEHRMAEQRHG
jgi:hypothetical protein